jgi:hypothetical protein
VSDTDTSKSPGCPDESIFQTSCSSVSGLATLVNFPGHKTQPSHFETCFIPLKSQTRTPQALSL